MSKWTSVKDRLPEDGDYYLASSGSTGAVGEAWFSEDGYWTWLYLLADDCRDDPSPATTHWMPLPEPPEKP